MCSSDLANELVTKDTNGRCNCYKVEVWEHENNSAVCETTPTLFTTTFNTEEVGVEEMVQIKPEPSTPPTSQVATPPPVKPETPPLHYPKSYNTFKDPFAGTSWGNNARRTK